MPEYRARSEKIIDEVRSVLCEFDRPVDARAVWHVVQRKIPHIGQASVARALSRLVHALGEAETSGAHPHTLYQYVSGRSVLPTGEVRTEHIAARQRESSYRPRNALRNAVLAVLRTGRHTVTSIADQIARQSPTLGVTKEDVRAALTRLHRENVIEKSGNRPNMVYWAKELAMGGQSTEVVQDQPEPVPAPTSLSVAPLDLLASPAPMLAPLPQARRIGGYSISTRTFLLADLNTPDQVTIFTSVMELDTQTKLPKNKRLLFKKHDAPKEYADTIRWVEDMERGAADPTGELLARAQRAEAEQGAAMQLATEASDALAKVTAELDELKKAVAPLMGLMGKV